jgi:hypothetical protein
MQLISIGENCYHIQMLQEINNFSSETCTCNAIAEVPTTGKIGSADILRSSGNPAEDDFITATKKKGGDIEAEISSENNKTTINFRTPMYAVCNSSSLALVSKTAKTKAFYVSCFSQGVSAREVENPLSKQIKSSWLPSTKL